MSADCETPRVTAEQLGLELAVRPADPAWLQQPMSRIERAFARFHRDNPSIYAELEERATRLLLAGRQWVGVKCLWEHLRFEMLATADAPAPTYNNDFTAMYARLLIHRRPALAAVIETRTRRERRSQEPTAA